MSDKTFIVLLSHMRSYTSVLAHILGSHPDICGYSELHCDTLTRSGMQNAREILQRRNDFATAKFLLDKLLHNGPQASELIDCRQVMPLIGVRQPEQTLKSIINMGQLYCQDANRKRRLTDAGYVTEYYVSRLRWLEYFVSRHRARCFIFRAEQMLADSQVLLSQIRSFLALEGNLQSSYQLFDNTGSPGHGDPSPRIRLGELQLRENCYEAIEIPLPLLEIAKQAYDTFWATAGGDGRL